MFIAGIIIVVTDLAFVLGYGAYSNDDFWDL